MTGNLTQEELDAIGFAECGTDVRIDRRVAIFNPGSISVGSHVRIDAFAVLAGGAAALTIGSFVHLGASCYLSAGDGGIRIGEFCTIAPRVAVHGHSDDYTGGLLTGGAVPSELTGGIGAPVVLEEHVIVGSGSVILPGVTIGRGAAVGALTTIRTNVAASDVVVGSPQVKVRTRDTSRLAELAGEARRRTR
jgi:dTDP-4-amino-4,6-dideoxy-D-glucose acyltransferase